MANWNENNQLVNGDSFLLYLTSGKTVVAYATSCSVQVDSETIDTSSKFSCKWASNMGGKASYTISADALYCQNVDGAISFDTLLEYMVKGDQIEWYMGEEKAWSGTCETNTHELDTDKTYYNGKAVVTSVSLEAGNNEIASCSITLTGAGEIQINGKKVGATE
jgi:predicted secreted protein